MKFFVTILAVLFYGNAFACSFARPFVDFEHTNEGNIIPKMPIFSVKSISRGEIGGAGSCADAGVLTLVTTSAEKDTGFIFSIEEGQFEGRLFHPKPMILASGHTGSDEYFFIWNDGRTTEQEPIDITVKIVAVSKDGGQSEPQYLKVTHKGVKKPWWQFW